MCISAGAWAVCDGYTVLYMETVLLLLNTSCTFPLLCVQIIDAPLSLSFPDST